MLKCKPHLLLGVSAEDKGVKFGGVEEHPWSSSLGGLQGVPGAAAHQAGQESLRPRDAWPSRLRTLQQDGPDKSGQRVCGNIALRPSYCRRCNFRAWSLPVLYFKLWSLFATICGLFWL